MRGASVHRHRGAPAVRGGRPRRPSPAPWPSLGRHRRRIGLDAQPTVRRTRTRVPCAGMSVGPGAAAEVGDQGVERRRRLRADEAVVHLHARCPVAVGEALGLLEGDGAVGGGAPGVDRQGTSSACSSSSAAPLSRQAMLVHTATRKGADRLGVEHVVEGAVPSTSAGVRPTSSAISTMASGSASRPAPGPGGRGGSGRSAARGRGRSAPGRRRQGVAHVPAHRGRWPLTGPPPP